MSVLRLGVIGLGVIGREHVRRIQAHAGCVLVGVSDSAPDAAARAAEYGVPNFKNLDLLLREVQPDGVILATSTSQHVDAVLHCLVARVPVLVEKSISDTLDAAQGLARCVEAAGIPVLVGHHRRHSAILEEACQIVRGGTLGKIVTVMGSATFVKPDSYFATAPWRKQKGAGPILTSLVHEIDTLRVLLGEIVEVQALASHATRQFEVEDTAAIGLRFANGALGSFMLSDCAAGPRNWAQTAGENGVYDRFADENCYFISGTQGSLAIPTLRLLRYHGEPSWMQPLVREDVRCPNADPLLRQLDHFCRVVRREVLPRCSVQEATRTLEVALAVARAAQTGERVVLA